MAVVREISTVASITMPVEEQWAIRRCRYAPEEGGEGRVCIATGMHGDEMMGQLIVYGIASRILKNPEHLHGTVDIYPMLNPQGLDISERMVPASTRLDMNRVFPGSPDGTALEYMCHLVMQDMLGADLVLDIHTSTQNKSELYEVRIGARDAQRLIDKAQALCPQVIWIYPDSSAFNVSLASSLCEAGTDAMILEADERRRRPLEIAAPVVEGIFCKLAQMGLWTGPARPLPQEAIPVVRSRENICRVTCQYPGVYVPEDLIGTRVEEGQVLGTVIDALHGEVRERVKAPCSGLMFSQRSYSAVYPGTLIARLRKEQA